LSYPAEMPLSPEVKQTNLIMNVKTIADIPVVVGGTERASYHGALIMVQLSKIDGIQIHIP